MSPSSPIDLNTLSIFNAVVETGGFTSAADKLGVAKAKVSVQIGRLERQLGLSLFTRTTRQVALTDAGRVLHGQCQPLLQGIVDALADVGSGQRELSGVLRVSTTVAHAEQALGPAMAQFALLHPALHFDFRTADKVSDMAAEGIDLSVRFGWLRESSMRATKLGEFDQYVIASPEYLRKAGRPKLPADLAAHEWVALTLLPTPYTWDLTSRADVKETVQVKGRFRADSPNAVLALIRAGAGLGVLEEFTAQPEIDAGRLVRLLPQWRLTRGGIFAVLPPGRHISPKVRAFIDFYRGYLAQQNGTKNLVR